MNRKPRVLMVNEASFLSTGYAVFGHEVLKRLHASGKYEIAELACYVTPDDQRIKQVPWKVFVNYPDQSDAQEIERYKSHPYNEFGGYAFEKTCIDFQPDIVFDIRDFWMLEFAERSPFRRLFKWVIMPTVDASPQHEQWLSTFMNADAVFSYSDWGANILREEGGGLINVQGSASPGADIDVFKPMNKAELRKKFGFEDGIQIIGTVMRNQGRKLYPELIQAFVDFQKTAPPNIAKKTYLYLHTSYPDQGWDIPRLIKQSGISRKIILTYKCRSCNAVFPSFYMDVTGPCLSCGKITATMPNTQNGVDRSTLARIMNLFDCYVQYANSEGFGMPMVEAASCGLTVFATDYSAMSDVVRKVRGYPIAVEAYRTDPDFGCKRAIPSNKDFVDKLIKFFSHTQSERDRKSQQARQAVERHYTWDMTTKKWMTVFDTLVNTRQFTHSKHSNYLNHPQHDIKKPSTCVSSTSAYNCPPKLHSPKPLSSYSGKNSNEELVRWAILNVLGRPDLLNSYLSLRLIRDLNWGISPKASQGNYANEQSMSATRGNTRPFGVSEMLTELTLMCENNNYWENKRWNAIQEKN